MVSTGIAVKKGSVRLLLLRRQYEFLMCYLHNHYSPDV